MPYTRRVSKPILGLVPLLIIVALTGAQRVPAEAAETGGCIKAKFKGIATTYNPNVSGWKTGGQGLATGGTYNPNGYEAALQLDLAKQYGCGYGSRKTCHAAVEGNGKAMIVLINDNGPMCADSATAARARDCTHRTARVIDLNEKAMRYLSGGRYGNNSGTIPDVTVTLLCDFNAKLGPLDEMERGAWAQKTFGVPLTDVTSPHSPDARPAPVGSPTTIGTPTGGEQPAYRQPADYSNYHSPSNTQPGQYFQPGTGLPGTAQLPIGTSPIYQGSSTADTLLNLITNTPGRIPTTTPFRLFIDRTIASTTTTRSQDTVIVTPLGSARPTQTFSPQTYMPRVSADTMVTETLSRIVAQLQTIFARIRAIVGTN